MSATSTFVGEVKESLVLAHISEEHLVSMEKASKIKSSSMDNPSTKSNFAENYKQEQSNDKNNGLPSH